MRALFGCVVLLSVCGAAQQTRPKKVLTPEQVAYEQEMKAYNERQAEIRKAANSAYDSEMAREKAPTCAGVWTTYDVNMCLAREQEISEATYKAFTSALRQMLASARPTWPGETVPYVGPTGPAATPETSTAAFEKAESAWKVYAEAECRAVDTEWRSGTIVNSMVSECELRLLRARMHELNTAYDNWLHPH